VLLAWAHAPADAGGTGDPSLSLLLGQAVAHGRDWGPLVAWAAGLALAVWLARRLPVPAGAGDRPGTHPRDDSRPLRVVAVPDDRGDGLGELAGAALALAGAGALLLWLGGPPWVPVDALVRALFEGPAGAEAHRLLSGGDGGLPVPLELVAEAAWTVCWAVWAWTAGSLVLGVLARVVVVLTHGAAWASRAVAVIDRFSPAATRRLAERAVIATVVLQLVARAPAAAAAPPAPPPAVAPGAVAPALTPVVAEDVAGGAPAAVSEAPAPDPAGGDSGATVHVVRPGDTLWAIAARHYGDGAQYPRLVAANAGRSMPTGERFTRGGVIRPG